MTNDDRLAPSVGAPAPPAFDDQFAAALRGFGPGGLLATLAILLGDFLVKPLSALLVLAWAWRSRTPWPEIGYVRPKSWIGSVAIGVVFGGAFKIGMKAIVMPLLGADPINHTYHFLVGNRAALPAMLYLVIVGGGFGEETLYRGYLFERLGKLFGSGGRAKITIVLLSTAVFAAAHYPDQGLAGAEQAVVTGLVFGTIFAATGRIFMLMVAHAAFDVAAIAMIYWNLETEVAHWLFK
jgi:membrane protease YdiL (CAAX protease family)